MSDGGGPSLREKENISRRKKSRNDEFAQAIARIAVAQVCESAGFQGFQQSALDTLSDITCRYIRDIGKRANSYVNLSGRTECNAFDIIQGLEDLGSSQGFSGASDVNRCLIGSGTIGEISQFIGTTEDVPFAFSVPSFPVNTRRNTLPSFAQAGESPPSEEVPSWLPRFPNPDTYKSSLSAPMGESEMKPNIADRGHKFLEPLGMDLQRRLVCNGSELPTGVATGAADCNPFLSMPLQYGEKEVSSVPVPSKLLEEDLENDLGIGTKHVSALEAFAPAIDALKNGVADSKKGSETALSHSRLKLKFGIGKKYQSTAVRHPVKEIAVVTSWFGKDEVKDDRKRRAEQILRDSMEIEEPKGDDSVVK